MGTTKLNGTHGTTKWCAEQIEKNGFNFGKGGLRGKGTYFWYYDGLNGKSDAIGLGKNWVHTINKKKPQHFKSDPSQPKICAVILVDLIVNKEHLLDLNDPKLNMLLNEHLIKAFKHINRIPNDHTRKEDRMKERIEIINLAYNDFVRLWSNKFKTPVNAILTRVRAPDNGYYKERGDIEAFQQPLCINLINNSGASMKINDIEHMGPI